MDFNRLWKTYNKYKKETDTDVNAGNKIPWVRVTAELIGGTLTGLVEVWNRQDGMDKRVKSVADRLEITRECVNSMQAEQRGFKKMLEGMAGNTSELLQDMTQAKAGIVDLWAHMADVRRIAKKGVKMASELSFRVDHNHEMTQDAYNRVNDMLAQNYGDRINQLAARVDRLDEWRGKTIAARAAVPVRVSSKPQWFPHQENGYCPTCNGANGNHYPDCHTTRRDIQAAILNAYSNIGNKAKYVCALCGSAYFGKHYLSCPAYHPVHAPAFTCVACNQHGTHLEGCPMAPVIRP